MSGLERETWTEDGERFAVIDYDHDGCALVSREVMHDLLQCAGFTLTEGES